MSGMSERSAGPTASGEEPLLTIRGLCKNFGALTVLTDVDLTVHRGEVVGLIGASGSGKSTLLRCINLLETPTVGEIRLAGELIGFRDHGRNRRVRLSDRELSTQRSRMAMVFQQFNLWPHKTALENVIEGPLIVKGLPTSRANALGMDLLEKVGLSDKAHTYPSRLSGGQQQRVGIARALALDPELMLFDEPTSAPDPELVGEVLKVMTALADEGKTMIVVTHEMGFAHEVCTQVAFLDGGRIVDHGAPDHVFGSSQNARTREFLERYRRARTPDAAA